MNETEYRVLTSLGGGAWYDLNHMMRVARVYTPKLTKDEFFTIVKKQVAYGYIKSRYDGVPLISYKNELGLTQRGSDCLEYWKEVRYARTDKKILLSEEGRAQITLAK